MCELCREPDPPNEEVDRLYAEVERLETENARLRAQIDTAVNTSNGLLDRCVALQKENDKLKAAIRELHL